MNKKLRGLLVIGLLALVAACASNAMPVSEQTDTRFAAGTVSLAAATQAAPPMDAFYDTDEEIADQVTLERERVILKNASLTVTVTDPAVKINEISAMAEGMGGWVVTSNSYTSSDANGEESTYGSITVRVPADRLAEAMERIKTGVEKVDAENVNGQDVTQEYVDLSSRLTNLQATERQLQTIMETARRVEDVLAVQRELTTVRGEIETIQGRLQYFDEAAAFSSIAVEVRPIQPGPVEQQSAGWTPGTAAANALGSLVGLVQSLIDTAITLAILVGPFVVIFGVPAWFVWRRRRQNRRAIASS